jgi:poly(ADP-ribose) glycohydrolase ARH3
MTRIVRAVRERALGRGRDVRVARRLARQRRRRARRRHRVPLLRRRRCAHARVIEATRVTHAHREAIDGALLVAHAIAWFLGGGERAPLLARLLDTLPSDEPLFRGKLVAIPQLIGRSRRDVVAALGHGVEARDAVPLALFAVLDAPDELGATIIHAIAFGGDTDTIGAITGALATATRR